MFGASFCQARIIVSWLPTFPFTKSVHSLFSHKRYYVTLILYVPFVTRKYQAHINNARKAYEIGDGYCVAKIPEIHPLLKDKLLKGCISGVLIDS